VRQNRQFVSEESKEFGKNRSWTFNNVRPDLWHGRWRNKTNLFLCITRCTCHAKISNVCYYGQQPPDKLGDSRTCAMLCRHLCPLLLPRNRYSLPTSPIIYWGWWVTSLLKRRAQGVKCDYRHFYRDSQHRRSFRWQGPHERKAYLPFLWPDQYLAFGWVKKTMGETCLEESSCWRKWWLELLLARRLSPQSCIPDTLIRTRTHRPTSTDHITNIDEEY